MKSIIIKITGLIIFFVSLFQFNSCTVIGFFIGRHSDNSKPDSLMFDIDQLKKIEPESEVFVFLKNGNNLSGIFKEIETKSPPEPLYNELKNINKVTDDVPLPIPGDTINIKLKNSKFMKCRFIGYDYNLIWIYLIDEDKTGRALLSKIPEIHNWQGDKIPKEKVNQLINAGKIPTYSNFVLEVNDEKKVINFSDINFVKLYVSKNDKYYGLIVGAAVDVTTLLILFPINVMNDFELRF